MRPIAAAEWECGRKISDDDQLAERVRLDVSYAAHCGLKSDIARLHVTLSGCEQSQQGNYLFDHLVGTGFASAHCGKSSRTLGDVGQDHDRH
jgi:hypothetical protein